MKVLLLGGSRFFGKRLARLLLEAGDEVTLLTRGRQDDGLGAAVSRLRADRRDPSALARALGAGEWDLVYDQVCYDADEAMDACRLFADRAGRYVFTSTASVYRFEKNDWHVEADFNPFSYRFDVKKTAQQDYGEAKRQAEAVFFQSSQVPVVALRFPIVLGDDDYTGRLKFHVDRVRAGGEIYFPNRDARMTFIHAADAAKALMHFRTRSFEGPVNAASGDPLKMTELATMLERELGKPLVWAGAPTDANHSPFGVERDMMICTEKLEELGFLCRPLADWLPGTIRAFRG